MCVFIVTLELRESCNMKCLRKRCLKEKYGLSLFFLLCLVGLVIHAYCYTCMYLSYGTLSDVDLHQGEETYIPKISVCFSISVLMSGNKMKNSLKDLSEIYESFTLGEIFNRSIASERILSSCSIRTNDTFLMLRLSSQCTSYLKINKLFRSGFLCYRFQVIERQNVSRRLFSRPVTMSTTSPGAILGIVFNRQLEQYIRYFNAFIHQQQLPLAQDTFFAHFSRAPMDFSMFYMTFNMKINRLMPAPYDSNCLYYDQEGTFDSRGDCFQICIIEKLKKSNHSLSMELTIDEHLMRKMNIQQMKYTSIESLRDAHYVHSLHTLESECEQSCKRPDCVSAYYTTTGITQTGRYPLSLVMYMPSEYRLEASTIAMCSLTQYFGDILSAISIWFGLSFFGTIRTLSFVTLSHHQSFISRVIPKTPSI